MDLERICEFGSVCIVGAPDQDHVDKIHAGQEWNDAPGHNLVYAKEAFISDVATSESSAYDDDGKDGAPPAVEERGVVGDACAAFGWRIVVE